MLGGRQGAPLLGSAADADCFCLSSPPSLTAAAAESLAAAAAVAAAAKGEEEEEEEGAAGEFPAFVAVASGSAVRRGASGEAEVLCCVLGRASWCVWAGSEGRCWAGWELRTEADLVGALPHCWHSRVPLGLREFLGLERWRRTVPSGCWPGGKVVLTSGSAVTKAKSRASGD